MAPGVHGVWTTRRLDNTASGPHGSLDDRAPGRQGVWTTRPRPYAPVDGCPLISGGRCIRAREAPPARLADPLARLPGPVHGGAGHLHRERGAALDPEEPGLLRGEPAMGGHCLFVDLRRPAAVRRSAGRPVRTPTHLLARTGAVHRGQPVGWVLPEPADPDRRSSPPGRGRRRPVPGHSDHPHRHLHRAAGPGQGARCLDCGSRRRRCGGGTLRGDPDRPVVVAMDPLRQRAHRDRGLLAGPLLPEGVASRG